MIIVLIIVIIVLIIVVRDSAPNKSTIIFQIIVPTIIVVIVVYIHKCPRGRGSAGRAPSGGRQRVGFWRWEAAAGKSRSCNSSYVAHHVDFCISSF